jgi:hypothetical protein
MPDSFFDGVMRESVIPALETAFGIPMTHTNAEGDETPLVALLDTAWAPVGEFGERMEARWTVEMAKSAGVQVGDTLSHAGAITEEDPDPDDVIWMLTQVIRDDGYTVQFAVRRSS